MRPPFWRALLIPRGGLFRHHVIFALHMVLFYVFFPFTGRKVPKPTCVQHRHDVHNPLPDAVHQLRREVQTGCRRGGGTLFLSIDRLIAVFVFQPFGDVRRQGHLTQFIQQLFKHAVVESARAPAILGCLQPARNRPSQRKRSRRSWRLPELDQRFPAVFIQPFEQQKLHCRRYPRAGRSAAQAAPQVSLTTSTSLGFR